MNLERIFLTLLLDALFIGALIILGLMITSVILPEKQSNLKLWLAFPLGAGSYTWFLFLLSWLGISLTLRTTLLSYFALLIPFSFFLISKDRGSKMSNRQPFTLIGPIRILAPRSIMVISLIGLVLFLISIVLSIGLSYSSWDAIAIWSIKGYGITLEETIFAGKVWGAHNLSRPLNIPILISLFRMLDGDILPGSKMIFTLYYSSLLGGIYTFWISQSIPKFIAGLGALFIGSIPIVFEHSTMGYANLPFCVYITLGVLNEIDGVAYGDCSRQLLSGLCLSLACWTRPEGAFFVPIVMLALFLSLRWLKIGRPDFKVWVIPVLGMLGVWSMFTQVYGEKTIMSQAFRTAFEAIRHLDLHLDSVYIIFRYVSAQFIKTDTWGLIVPVVAILILINRKKINHRENRISMVLFTAVLSMGFATGAFFYLASFVRDLYWQLDTSANRMFLPLSIMILVWAIMLSADPSHDEKVSRMINL
ncbi:MAG: hypothetical protein P8Z42_03170 [Anaerolineales bacterium]